MSLFPLVPSTQAPPQFQPTLDGVQYTAIITWNLFGQRYYLNLYALTGALILCRAIVESPASLLLTAQSWDSASGFVTATTQDPHGYDLGTVVDLTMSGALPGTFNSAQQVTATSPNMFIYPLASDPGMCVQPGMASYLINLIGGYFETSTMVFRDNQFEVDP